MLRIILLMLLNFQCLIQVKCSANCELPINYKSLHWSYKQDCSGPSHWQQISGKYCSLKRQSPIDLNYADARYDPYLTTPIIGRVSGKSMKSFGKYKVKNTGHGVQIDFPDKEWQITYKGSDMINYVAQFHWHWGNSSTNIGSEHAINGRHFDMEAHLVTYNSIYPRGYGSPESVLAIFGIMYKVADTASDKIMDTVIKTFENPSIAKEQDPIQTVEIDGFNINELWPSTLSRFFRYDGSLTTPPCNQNAIWTVFETHKTISKKNLNKFRTMLKSSSNEPLSDNIRPLQKLNVQGGGYTQRIITTSFELPASVSSFAQISKGTIFFIIMSAFYSLMI